MLDELCQNLEQLSGSITDLILSQNNITDKGMLILMSYLMKWKSLRFINLSYNDKITDTSVPLIKDAIIDSSAIDDVNIFATAVSNFYECKVATAIKAIKHGYPELKCPDHAITDVMMAEICTAIKSHGCKNLVLIDLSRNRLESKGVILLMNMLGEFNSRVESLILRWNKMDDEFVESLGEFIEKSSSIKNIDLTSTGVTDTGIKILVPYLMANSSLEIVDLSFNRSIRDFSVPLLLEAVKHSHLQEVVIRNTSISAACRVELSDVLLIPVEARTVLIKSNTKSAAKGC